jgi:poly(A)-specific ribonuclease
MCEITIDNFDSKFQEISYNLQKANFIGIDTEFSGLHLDNAEPGLADSADQRYKKLKKSIQLFSVVQVGISTFRYCNEQKSFISDSYNFYLYSRHYGLNSDSINSFQSSSVEFLCKYEFDFNKVCIYI